MFPITDPDFIACVIEAESRPSRKALVGFQSRFETVVKEVIAPDDLTLEELAEFPQIYGIPLETNQF